MEHPKPVGNGRIGNFDALQGRGKTIIMAGSWLQRTAVVVLVVVPTTACAAYLSRGQSSLEKDVCTCMRACAVRA